MLFLIRGKIKQRKLWKKHSYFCSRKLTFQWAVPLSDRKLIQWRFWKAINWKLRECKLLFLVLLRIVEKLSGYENALQNLKNGYFQFLVSNFRKLWKKTEFCFQYLKVKSFLFLEKMYLETLPIGANQLMYLLIEINTELTIIL